jgi:hypothetical protein
MASDYFSCLCAFLRLEETLIHWGYRLGQPQSPVSPKTGRGVAGCPRGGGRRKPAHSEGLRRRGKLPPQIRALKIIHLMTLRLP